MKLPSEEIAVVATIDPVSQSAATVLSDAVDLSKYQRYFAVLLLGALGASATVDFKLQSAATSGGSYSDVSGFAVTQLTKAGSDDNKQVILEFSPLAVRQANADAAFVKGALTVATAACLVGVVIFGVGPRYGLAFDDDLASVDEIVSKVN